MVHSNFGCVLGPGFEQKPCRLDGKALNETTSEHNSQPATTYLRGDSYNELPMPLFSFLCVFLSAYATNSSRALHKIKVRHLNRCSLQPQSSFLLGPTVNLKQSEHRALATRSRLLSGTSASNADLNRSTVSGEKGWRIRVCV